MSQSLQRFQRGNVGIHDLRLTILALANASNGGFRHFKERRVPPALVLAQHLDLAATTPMPTLDHRIQTIRASLGRVDMGRIDPEHPKRRRLRKTSGRRHRQSSKAMWMLHHYRGSLSTCTFRDLLPLTP